MRVKRIGIFSALAVAAAWGLESHDPGGRAARSAGEPPAAAGMVVHIDPASGAFVEPREGAVPVVLDGEVLNALSTSAQGLAETPSPVAGGGVMVDLRGRFQSTHVAVLDGEGRLTAPCRSGLPHARLAHGASGAAADSIAEVGP